MSEGDNYRFLAFARIYSGKIKRGQKLYVLGPKHNPAEAIEQVGVTRLHDGCLGLLSCKLCKHVRFKLSGMFRVLQFNLAWRQQRFLLFVVVLHQIASNYDYGHKSFHK